jgi:hypothetical protein
MLLGAFTSEAPQVYHGRERLNIGRWHWLVPVLSLWRSRPRRLRQRQCLHALCVENLGGLRRHRAGGSDSGSQAQHMLYHALRDLQTLSIAGVHKLLEYLQPHSQWQPRVIPVSAQQQRIKWRVPYWVWLGITT